MLVQYNTTSHYYYDYWSTIVQLFMLQISKRTAGSVALPEVGGGEDWAEGGGGEQLLQDQVRPDKAFPDQVRPDEPLSDEVRPDKGLPDETLQHISSQQVCQEQLQKSTRKLPPLLQQGKR